MYVILQYNNHAYFHEGLHLPHLLLRFYIRFIIYRTVKNIGGEKTKNYSILPWFFLFCNFHNIPYAIGLQFAKIFSAKLPTILICQTFLPPKFSTV